MAITLASDVLGDAETTDNIGIGDVGSAARVWVRYWPTALTAARRYVDPAEVPGLAAEALIGTIAAIAIGRGPREDVEEFVTSAVRELGEGDDQTPDPSNAAGHPDVFVSATMTRSFAELDATTQDSLRSVADAHTVDGESARALTVLQHYYLAEHADTAESAACRRPHIALMSVAEGSTQTMSGECWLHLSTCAWCTEAFHEIAYSSVALDALVDPAVLRPVVPAPVLPVAVALPLAPEPLAAEPVELEPWAAAPVVAEDEAAEAPVVIGVRRRSRRGRLVAVALVTVAAVGVGAALLAGGDDTPTPTAADTTPSATPVSDLATSPGDPTTPPSIGGPTAPETVPTVPETTTAVPTPTATATVQAVATTTAAKPSKKPTPSKTPTKKPSSSPTSRPSTPPTTPAPTQAPTPTPTTTPKPCNPLQHLLGLC